MSTQVFPTLAGQGWDISREVEWDTSINENTSGKERRIANMTYPRYNYEVKFNFLRQGTVAGVAFTEMAQLFGFFNARQGAFDTFLYQDKSDNSVTTQTINIGDGVTLAFQLVKAFGGFVEPVLAPNVVSAVYLNGVLQSGSAYTVSTWGSASPGVITFNSPPASLAAITADFTYYYPCRFGDDRFSVNNFMSSLYEGKKLTFKTVKN